MQSVDRFVGDYVKPVMHHPVCQWMSHATLEVIGIIASAKFLDHLAKTFLTPSKAISRREIYATIVKAPVLEEILFRFFVLKGIHLTHRMLNHFQIELYLPVELKIFCQAYVQMVYLISEVAKTVFSYLPLLNRLVVESEDEKGLSPEEKKQMQLENISRVHFSAFIFAAAHLANPHENKIGAIVHFVWSYLGGIVYGHLSEKYDSLVPGIIAHGFNNLIAVAIPLYSSYAMIIALFVNRIACYTLSVTSKK